MVRHCLFVPPAPRLLASALVPAAELHNAIDWAGTYLVRADDALFNQAGAVGQDEPGCGGLPWEYQAVAPLSLDDVLPPDFGDFDAAAFEAMLGSGGATLPPAPTTISLLAGLPSSPSCQLPAAAAPSGGEGVLSGATAAPPSPTPPSASPAICTTPSACPPPAVSLASEPATPLGQATEPAVAQPTEQPAAAQQEASEVCAAPTPEPVDAALSAAAAATPSAGQHAAAAAAAAAAVGSSCRRRRGGGVSQTAPLGFSWVTAEFGTVTGWDGPTVLVHLPGGCRAVVPAACPSCGVAPYSEADWASGYLTRGGAPKKGDPNDCRQGAGRRPDQDNVVGWLMTHSASMSDDLLEFFHLSKSTMCRERKKADVKNPRSTKQKAAAGRGNRKNKPEEAEEAPALPAVPAKRRKGAQRG